MLVFAALKLARLLSVSIEEMDVSAVLAKLMTLRMLMRDFLQWKEEFVSNTPTK